MKLPKALKSIRMKLFFTLTVVVVIIVFLLIFINSIVLETYYLYSKVNTLLNVYSDVNDYYNNDFSLSEIAENNNITRQAVRDMIKKGESKLFEFEEKLLIMKKMQKQEKQIQSIIAELSKIKDTSSDKKIEKILNNVTKELICLN